MRTEKLNETKHRNVFSRLDRQMAASLLLAFAAVTVSGIRTEDLPDEPPVEAQSSFRVRYARIGGRAEFPCIDGEASTRYSGEGMNSLLSHAHWKGPEGEVVASGGPEGSRTSVDGEKNFVITFVKVTDAGLYSCIVDERRNFTHGLELSVYAIPEVALQTPFVFKVIGNCNYSLAHMGALMEAVEDQLCGKFSSITGQREDCQYNVTLVCRPFQTYMAIMSERKGYPKSGTDGIKMASVVPDGILSPGGGRMRNKKVLRLPLVTSQSPLGTFQDRKSGRRMERDSTQIFDDDDDVVDDGDAVDDDDEIRINATSTTGAARRTSRSNDSASSSAEGLEIVDLTSDVGRDPTDDSAPSETRRKTKTRRSDFEPHGEFSKDPEDLRYKNLEDELKIRRQAVRITSRAGADKLFEMDEEEEEEEEEEENKIEVLIMYLLKTPHPLFNPPPCGDECILSLKVKHVSWQPKVVSNMVRFIRYSSKLPSGVSLVGGSTSKRRIVLFCLPGFFLDGSLCLPCSPGSFGMSGSRSSCDRCPVDSYQDDFGSKECKRCPNGTGTKDQPGSSRPEECRASGEAEKRLGGEVLSSIWKSFVFFSGVVTCFLLLERLRRFMFPADHVLDDVDRQVDEIRTKRRLGLDLISRSSRRRGLRPKKRPL